MVQDASNKKLGGWEEGYLHVQLDGVLPTEKRKYAEKTLKTMDGQSVG